MDFSKIKKISFILLILFILLFPFWCVRGLCTEGEEIEFSTLDNTAIDGGSLSLVSTNAFYTYYLPLEKGYIYHIYINYHSDNRIAFSNSIDIGSSVYNYQRFNSAGDYEITINSDTFNYLFFDFSGQYAGVAPTYSITREPATSMNNTVDQLVNNVGINSIWSIFDISINYIVVVVLFAFGCYIIFKIIRKISRGKEGL